jgi:hypothetical protein
VQRPDGPLQVIGLARHGVLCWPHNSGRSHAGTARHRRILHLEFAAAPELPKGFAWHTFRPGAYKGTV